MHHIMGCRFVLAALPFWCAGQPLCTHDNTWRNCSYAVATMATRPALLEVALFLRTLRRFDASRRVYVASDTAVAAYVSRETNATAVPCLVKYENYSRVWMKKKRWGSMQGRTRERNSQLQRLISRPFSTRFG